MTSPALDYFAREAADCLARLRAWRAGGVTSADPTRAEDARAAARALRGAATMASEPEFAALGAAFERAAAAAEDTDGVLGAALDQALAAGDQAAAPHGHSARRLRGPCVPRPACSRRRPMHEGSPTAYLRARPRAWFPFVRSPATVTPNSSSGGHRRHPPRRTAGSATPARRSPAPCSAWWRTPERRPTTARPLPR
jgi:hypothetical protein